MTIDRTHRPGCAVAARARRARPLARLTAAALSVALAGVAQAADIALGADVQSLLDHARHQSPELAAMRQEAVAAQERVQSAGALPDPVLRVELEDIGNHGIDSSPSLLPWRVGGTKYTLMQTLPSWGKRGLREEVAAAEAQQAGARTGAAWTELAARIKTVYAQYYLAAGAERLTREVLELMKRLEQIAQARYAGGLVMQQDAIRAQLEQTAMRSELIAFDSEKRQLRARLNALLARDAAAALAEPEALRSVPAPAAFDAAELARRAEASSPSLRAEDARLIGAERNRDLTVRNRYPDILVGVSPMQTRSRITAWGVMLELNIPLQQGARRSQEREAEAMVGAARSRRESLAQQLRGELVANLAAIDAARQSEALVANQLLPQSELSLRSALAGYENGKVEFAALLDAQRQIRKARLDRLKTRVEVQMRLAEIERIVGEDL